MNLITYLERQNILISITHNNYLRIRGISLFDEPDRSRLLKWIAQNKNHIISELRERSERSRHSGVGSAKEGAEKVRKKVTRDMVRAWKTARPWLLENLEELQSKGWTRKSLFRADRLLYPCGNWGPAWCSNWLREGVELHIEPEGAICWTWFQHDGRKICQRVHTQQF